MLLEWTGCVVRVDRLCCKSGLAMLLECTDYIVRVNWLCLCCYSGLAVLLLSCSYVTVVVKVDY